MLHCAESQKAWSFSNISFAFSYVSSLTQNADALHLDYQQPTLFTYGSMSCRTNMLRGILLNRSSGHSPRDGQQFYPKICQNLEFQTFTSEAD